MFQSSHNFRGVVKYLIIINIAIFFAAQLLPGAGIDPGVLAAGPINQPGFYPTQILTHMFTHFEFGHLLFNMLALYFIGPIVEMVWGPKRFLSYYLICGVGGFALHMLVLLLTHSSAGIVGASGAISGILVAFAFLFPNQILSLIFPPIEMRAKYFVLMIFGIDLVLGVSGRGTGVAHFGHLGGALAGLIMLMIWYKGRLRF
jgi:membrane associated rhomboid family serine protease